MKKASIILPIVIVAFIVLLFNFRGITRAGDNTGLIKGKLSKCPNKPNCVCSEHKDDTSHYIDPIIIPQNNTDDLLSLLKNVIREMGGNVQVESGNYLAATFTSTIFKFVDDLEIRVNSTEKIIHIRSASRVGYTDFGVNKKRTELLKKIFYNKISEANKSLQLSP